MQQTGSRALTKPQSQLSVAFNLNYTPILKVRCFLITAALWRSVFKSESRFVHERTGDVKHVPANGFTLFK